MLKPTETQLDMPSISILNYGHEMHPASEAAVLPVHSYGPRVSRTYEAIGLEVIVACHVFVFRQNVTYGHVIGPPEGADVCWWSASVPVFCCSWGFFGVR